MPKRLARPELHRRNWQTLMLIVFVAGFAGAVVFGVINQLQDKSQGKDIDHLIAANVARVAACERGNEGGKAAVRNYLGDIANLSADRDLLRGSLALSPAARYIFGPAIAAKSVAIRSKIDSIEGLLRPRREFSVAPFGHAVRWGVEHDPEGLVEAAVLDCEKAYPFHPGRHA